MAVGLRQELFAELGVPLAAPRVHATPDIGEGHIVLSLHEVPAKILPVPADLRGEALTEWVRGQTLDVLRARAADFLGLAEVQRLLDELEQFAPATVRNVVPKPLSLVTLTDVLRRLVEEGLSIRDLRGILESLSTAAVAEKDPLALAEYARSQMRRAITFRLTAGLGRLDVILIDPLIEDTVRKAITRTPAGAFLTLAPPAARDVIASIKRAVAGRSDGEAEAQPDIVVLTQPDIRRFVRKLLEPELPSAWVISFAELLPEVSIKPVAHALPK
jgi:type III secretion protein V